MPDFLSPPAAAAYLAERGLSVHHRTVRRWVKTGRLQALTLPSGHLRISTADLDGILAAPAHVVEPTEAAS